MTDKDDLIAISCETVQWAFKCPMRWQDLKVIDKEDVRFCNQCQRTVHRCDTIEELNLNAREGNCVAWAGREANVRKRGPMVLGEATVKYQA